MHRIPSRPYPSRLARVLREDDGFGLIEVLVSAVMVVIVATATLNLIDRTNQASASSRSRVVASNLAHAALNNMRSLTFSNLQDYSDTSTVTQGHVTYTVASQATWTTDTGATLNCSSSGAYAPYLKVISTVTWPNMGNIKPITATSLVTPRATDVYSGAGSLVVSVKNAAGQPVPGADVTVQGTTLTTDAAGCAIYHFLTAGSSTVTWSKSGLIAPNGQAVGTADVSITNNTIASITPLLDTAASATTTFKRDASGFPAVNWISGQATTGGTFYETKWAKTTNGTSIKNDAAGTVNHSSLFPTTAGYGFYAGNCAGNDPSVYVSNFGTTHPEAFKTPAPGGSASPTAYLKQAWFSIKRTAGTASYEIQLTPYTSSTLTQMTGCDDTPLSYIDTLSSNNATSVPLDLPYGLYNVCVDNQQSGSSGRAVATNGTTQYLAVMPGGTIRAGTPADNTGTSAAPPFSFDLSVSTTKRSC